MNTNCKMFSVSPTYMTVDNVDNVDRDTLEEYNRHMHTQFVFK